MKDRLFGKPVITQEAMRKRVRALGLQITKDYQGKNLLLIGVLKGAFAFFADLCPAISLPLQVDFLKVARHPDKRRKDGGSISISSNVSLDLKNYDVLVVEDIVDSGYTLTFLKEVILAQHPKSLRFCTLLDKPERRKVAIAADYIGFVIPDKFVVGYGLDYKNKYRNLPYIATLDNISDDY